MNFLTISIKNTLPTPPIVLTKDAGDRLLLRKETTEIYLDTLDTSVDNVLSGMGSTIGNVLFLFDSTFEIDPALEANLETGFLRIKEPEQLMMIDLQRTRLSGVEVVSLGFEHYKAAKRFIDKKILGEIYMMQSDEKSTMPFYAQLREAYLESSNWIEIGFASYLDIECVIAAPTATITELPVKPTDMQRKRAETIDFTLELPLWKRYRLEFPPHSGFHVVRMNRGKHVLVDGSGQKFWEIHDEVFKIFVG